MKKTIVEISNVNKEINYDSKVFFIGSCFSDEVGGRLSQLGFDTLVNPFGVVFNPISIFNLLKFNAPSEKRLVLNDDVYLHYDLHSDIHGYSKDELLNKIQEVQTETQSFLKDCSHIYVTLGTAWVFDYENEVVNNCHKQAQSNFNKRLLTSEEIKQSLLGIIESIQNINSDANIVFTLSPVRHSKNGMVENSISKARLLTAVHEVIGESITYFPSYEITIDELRDYSNFASDGVHLSKDASDYVFNRFEESYFDEETKKVVTQYRGLLSRMNHRPQFERSANWVKFQKKLDLDLDEFKMKHPNVRVKK